jgi:steroid delta-isomerase-like uncharacterized protein
MDEVPAVVRAYLEAYNDKDVDALVACLADDVVFESVSGGAVTARASGREAFADLARQSAALFSERRQAVSDCIAAGNRVAIKVDFHAVVAGDWPNGWKAGETLSLKGASFFTLADGHIAEIVDIS